jgi:dTMP kinase
MADGGRLITIEGVDGAGKSTLARALETALRKRGIDVEQLREPGGVEASERVRALVSDPALTIGARAEALLYAAARAQLVEEVLLPTLAAGRWVLLDRFVDSSLAYQGAGRGLGIAEIRELNLFATGGIEPDRTLLLDLPGASARKRTGRRSGAPDRLEQEGDQFFATIADAYAGLARAEPDRIRVLDATRPRREVLEQALEALEELL